MLRRWNVTIVLAACGALLAVAGVAGGSAGGVAGSLVLLGSAVLLSPAVFPRPLAAAEAQRLSASDGRPVLYWRPGCPYCLRLRARLGGAGRRMHWVDIWRDPAGAAAVRAVAGGNETVPTVVFADESFVNPDPAWLRGRLLGR